MHVVLEIEKNDEDINEILKKIVFYFKPLLEELPVASRKCLLNYVSFFFK